MYNISRLLAEITINDTSMEVKTMMGERTTRMESHYEAIEDLLNSDKDQINRILYSREIKTLEKRFSEIKIEVKSVYSDRLYNCIIKKIK